MEIFLSNPLLLIAILIGTILVINQVRLWHMASRFKERQQFDDEEFRRLFPANPDLGDIAVRARKVLADHLKMDLRGIRPEDRLDEDLDVGIGSNVELLWELEKEFDIDFEVEDLDKFEKLVPSLNTFTDLVHAVAERAGSTATKRDIEDEETGRDWHDAIGYAWFAGLGIAVVGSLLDFEWAWSVGLVIAVLPLSVGALWQAGIIAKGALTELRQVGFGPALEHPLGLVFSVFLFAVLLAVAGGLMWVAITVLVEAWSQN